jgi:hypothetical protein
MPALPFAAAWTSNHGILVGHLLQERRKRLAAVLTQHFNGWSAHSFHPKLAAWDFPIIPGRPMTTCHIGCIDYRNEF